MAQCVSECRINRSCSWTDLTWAWVKTKTRLSKNNRTAKLSNYRTCLDVHLLPSHPSRFLSMSKLATYSYAAKTWNRRDGLVLVCFPCLNLIGGVLQACILSFLHFSHSRKQCRPFVFLFLDRVAFWGGRRLGRWRQSGGLCLRLRANTMLQGGGVISVMLT